MYNGYLSLNGVEILNVTRVTAYIQTYLTSLHVQNTRPLDLTAVLGHSGYKNPWTDNAPWYKPSRPATGQFFGLFPGKLEGDTDSTRTLAVTEMVGDGAVPGQPRHASRDIKLTAMALASSDEGMEEGLAWLRDVLTVEPADGFGRTLRMFASAPPSKAQASALWRSFYRVDVSQPLRVVEEFPKTPTRAKAVLVEIIFTAGIPWAWTDPARVAVMNLSKGYSFTDPAGEDCSATATDLVYKNFINDPYFTAISKPPAPPTIKPPNLIDIESWRRMTCKIQQNQSQRWGRMVPVVNVDAGASAVQFVRLRFYRDGWASCDYEGEFLISYIPAYSTLELDGTQRKAYIKNRTTGALTPAGHLLFGSDGKPFTWPTLGNHYNYVMCADTMPGQDVSVTLNVAVRE